MSASTLVQLSPEIDALSPRQDNFSPDESLLLWQDSQSKLSCYYAPFEHVNPSAQLIIVGITPGHTQMNRSLNAFKHAQEQGLDTQAALAYVKQQASLSGTMRPRIIDMLNRLGYAKQLGISCCSLLWTTHHHLVHFCSVLKYPLFINGKDYSGQVSVRRHAQLQQLMRDEFVQDLSGINPQAQIVPLGEMVADALSYLMETGQLSHSLPMIENRVVAPPHPSGANAESIALLMMNDFPSLPEYQEQMYQAYLSKQSWLKKPHGQPQDETKYKKARSARWYAIERVRQAYQL